MVTDAPVRQSRTQIQEDRRGEEVTEPINGECIVPYFRHLFRNPDIVQVYQFDILAAPAITASGTGEGHGAFGAPFTVLSASVPRVPGLEVDHAKVSWLISLLPS